MKKFIPVCLGITAVAAAGAVIGYKKLRDMDFIERCNMCSDKFVKAISKLQEGLPEPPVDTENEMLESASYTRGEHSAVNNKKLKWSLGYNQQSILPSDSEKKKYCIAGNTRFPANYSNGVLDDIRVRTVALDDNSGNGAVVLCSVDCIGISNKNVIKIRNMLSDFSKENNISFVSISSTHTHSSVDTMGIWGEILSVLPNNRKFLKKGEGQLKDSCDNEYMDFLFEKICLSVKEAFQDMKPGRLYESYMGTNSQEQLNDDSSLKERGLFGYVWDRREPYDCSTQLLRLRFSPDDRNERDTVILNFGAHPYINSMKIKGQGNGDMISGDFVYYLGDFIERNNCNFVYFNGPVAAVYPTRLYAGKVDLKTQAKCVGEEIGRISLAMTMSEDEIQKNPVFSPGAYEACAGIFRHGEVSEYSRWISRKGEEVIKEKELEPVLKLNVKKAELQVDNPIFYCIAKHRIGNFTVLPGENGRYTSVTEVGLLELGSRKIAFVPGELEPAVLSGSQAVRSEESFSKTKFSSVPLSESACDDELTVFGLTNDAIGYIIPDNDFSMMFLGTGKVMKELFGTHYLEIFSFGKNTAVTVADTFKSICEDVKK